MSESKYTVRIETVEVMQLGVVKDMAHAKNIGPRIMEGMPKVEQRLKGLGVSTHGKAVVVYLPDTGSHSWEEPPGIPVEIGFQLLQPLESDSPPMVRSSTPGGRAAVVTHYGSYEELPRAHAAIHQWCRDNHVTPTWRNWEVYDDDHPEDPSKNRTDVYSLLQ